jgi:hypothetical protein
MIDLNGICRQSLDLHEERLASAARRRVLAELSSPVAEPGSNRRPLRTQLAMTLRKLAEHLEPVPSQPRLALLRAVAHREISVDQALDLLQSANGHQPTREVRR